MDAWTHQQRDEEQTFPADRSHLPRVPHPDQANQHAKNAPTNGTKQHSIDLAKACICKLDYNCNRILLTPHETAKTHATQTYQSIVWLDRKDDHMQICPCTVTPTTHAGDNATQKWEADDEETEATQFVTNPCGQITYI